MAIICLSFAQYAVEAFVTECDPPRGVVKMVALVAIGKINILGITTIFVKVLIPVYVIFPNILKNGFSPPQ